MLLLTPRLKRSLELNHPDRSGPQKIKKNDFDFDQIVDNDLGASPSQLSSVKERPTHPSPETNMASTGRCMTVREAIDSYVSYRDLMRAGRLSFLQEQARELFDECHQLRRAHPESDSCYLPVDLTDDIMMYPIEIIQWMKEARAGKKKLEASIRRNAKLFPHVYAFPRIDGVQLVAKCQDDRSRRLHRLFATVKYLRGKMQELLDDGVEIPIKIQQTVEQLTAAGEDEFMKFSAPDMGRVVHILLTIVTHRDRQAMTKTNDRKRSREDTDESDRVVKTTRVINRIED